ncbi:MAG: nucleotidyltransferase family protein [Betaproteobacteria bacterium]|nr:nucleotidyltransferase family protein [Betaproteobacteria bacterium]
MILAAGRGERMRPLTDHTPKSMLQVGGKALIFRHLEKLADAGFRSVVINHAHLGEQLETAVGDGSRWNLAIRFSPEAQALETAGGIRNALPLLREQVFAVVNADVYSGYDYARLAEAIRQMQPATLAHLVLVNNPPHHPEGDFCLEGNLVRAGSKDLLTFSGVGAYRAALFDPVAPGSKHPLAPLLREQMALGKITGEHFRGAWDDVGTPQRLADLEARLQQAPDR